MSMDDPTLGSARRAEVSADAHLQALAVSMQSAKGAFAVLLGSGVSDPAGIPSGWQLTRLLLEKLATLDGGPLPTDLEAWFADSFGQDATYSNVLEACATSPGLRSDLLHAYFEPSDEDRVDGRKVPTRAHEAIASLARRNYVRVILTTNFDRLMEQALAAENVTPQVISAPDQIAAMRPLMLAPLTVVKINGDYMSLATKNTSHELASYDERLRELVDRILGDLGLIVSGWSGEYDPWLRDRLRSMARSNYPLCWTYRGRIRGQVTPLLDELGALRIKVDDADTLFGTLDERVATLELMTEGQGLGTAQTFSTAVRLLQDERTAGRFEAMLRRELAAVVGLLNTTEDGVHFVQKLASPVLSRTEYFDQIEALTARLRVLMVAGGAYGRPERAHVLTTCIEQLAQDVGRNATGWRQGFTLYPAVLACYAAGVAAIAERNYANLGAVVVAPRVRDATQAAYTVRALPQLDVVKVASPVDWQDGASPQQQMVAANERVLRVLAPDLVPLAVQPRDVEDWFDRFELLKLLSLGFHIMRDEQRRAPAFAGSARILDAGGWDMRDAKQLVKVLGHEAWAAGPTWGPIRAGLFDSVDSFRSVADALVER